MKLLSHYKIDLVLDVGANIGQYAEQLRQLGYRGRIVSFEPLSSAFASLRGRTEKERNWTAVNVALGDKKGTATINVAGNSESSSILPMLDAHVRSAPQSAYVGTEQVQVETLADVLRAHRRTGERVFIKIDAQGYEKQILDGAGDTLSHVDGLQLEMSLVPLYEGELLLPRMVDLLASRGFTLMSLEPGHSDPASGQLLQTDGVFFRSLSS